MTKQITILGATGSVGQSTLKVIAANPGRFSVAALAAGRDAEKLAAVARATGARFVAIADPTQYAALKALLSGSGAKVAAGEAAVVEAAEREADIVVAAITGVAGLRSTYAAVRRGRQVAIANKESLVCAGTLVMEAARSCRTTILPMDSEHNALFQAIANAGAETIEKLIITASGGPFRTWSAERIAAATLEQALAHPNWSMGAKVTIDSASLMNKGLELIEAQHLFGIAPERLSVLVHPQSLVHGLVQFRDGAVIAGLAVHDMRVPIAHCLGYPERIDSGSARLDLAAVGSLSFEAPDLERFPALRLAIEAMTAGGSAPAILNAANEIAVAAFIAGQIPFSHIPAVVSDTLAASGRELSAKAPADIDEALAVDHTSRKIAELHMRRRLTLAT